MPTRTQIKLGWHQCRTPGCSGVARSNIAAYCEKCRKRVRASGDAQQITLRKPELRPYIEAARAAVSRGNAPLIRSSLEQIATFLRNHCQRYLDAYHRGTPSNRHMVAACGEILKVTRTAEPEEIALTVAALYLMQERAPRRFPSDAGFDGQLVRQVRSLHGIAMGRTVTLATGKDRNWYRTLSIQTTQFIAAYLKEAYAEFVGHVMTSERRRREERTRLAMDLARGFDEEPQAA
jgi:hypothetical protein